MIAYFYNAYLAPIKTFERSARLFLAMTVIDGLIYSMWSLFFNFYVLGAGYDRAFLGLVNAMPFIAAFVLGIPLGLLSDRIGRKRALIIGLAVSSLAMTVQVTVSAPTLMLAAAFVTGAGNCLFIVSQAPLMVKLSDAHNRTLLFSLNFGLQTLAGVFGSLFAGQLPRAFGIMLHVAAGSAPAYQAVLVVSVALGATALVPLFMMQEPASRPDEHPNAGSSSGGWRVVRLALKLAIPQLIIGLGAAILIPYVNVFLRDKFAVTDASLGVLFSLSELIIGVGSLIGPRLALGLGSKIRAVVATQLASLIFMLMMGFSPWFWPAVIGFLMRGALMNISAPLYSAFAMEQVPERDQGRVNSIQSIAWQAGWAVGPYISGLVQARFGFAPLFAATTLLYFVASILTWFLFGKVGQGEAVLAPETA